MKNVVLQEHFVEAEEEEILVEDVVDRVGVGEDVVEIEVECAVDVECVEEIAEECVEVEEVVEEIADPEVVVEVEIVEDSNPLGESENL
jgi:hypothetical protein